MSWTLSAVDRLGTSMHLELCNATAVEVKVTGAVWALTGCCRASAGARLSTKARAPKRGSIRGRRTSPLLRGPAPGGFGGAPGRWSALTWLDLRKTSAV